MAQSNKKLPDSQQENLGFDIGILNNTREIANAVSSSIRNCKYSRYHIAARISELVGREITKTMLDHYSGESHDRHVIPADLVKAFCHVTRSNKLKKTFMEPGEMLASGKDAQYLELAKAEVKQDRLAKRIKELKAHL